MLSPANAKEPYRRHPHLYEINTYAWLEELSRREKRRITLGSVPASEWNRIQSLGFDFVWLMGVWKRSLQGRRIMRTDPQYFASYDEALPGWSIPDVVGSPYSIQDYSPDPRMANWQDLDAARAELNRRGIKLILDFVPNHTGLDHVWIWRHPEFYVQGTLDDFRHNPAAYFLSENEEDSAFIARGKDPYFPAWPDTAQLNYFQPALRDAMIGVLRTIAEHADGVRCDMAMLVLNDIFTQTWGKHLEGIPAPQEEFWPRAAAALPGFVWLGEVYWDLEQRMQQLGMDFTYDKRLYDRLRGSSPQDVRLHLTADIAYQSRLARFLENHDEPRSAAVFGAQKLPAVATLAFTLPGMRFYHHGQLEGRKIHLPIQLRTGAELLDSPEAVIQELWQTLLKITSEEVFHAGEWRLLEVRPAGDASFCNLIASQWSRGRDLKIIAVNLGDMSSSGNVVIPAELFDASLNYALHDQLNDKTYEWRGQDLARSGLYVKLDAFRSHIFNVSPR
ncbi:MAG: alpha-amylase [Acidobacteriota bacterium]|nr:alpha-amylase [Acidobacteriota bacterium]